MKNVSTLDVVINSFFLLLFSIVQNLSIISPYRLCDYIQNELYSFIFKRFLLFVVLFVIMILLNLCFKFIFKLIKYSNPVLSKKMILLIFIVLFLSFLLNIYNILNFNCVNVYE